jgi:type II secretion system protein H
MRLAFTRADIEENMHSRKRGFTLIELLIVIVIVGILTMIALPKVGRSARSNAVHAASRKAVAYLAQARSLAIQNGRGARFYVDGNRIRVGTVNEDGMATDVGAQDLGEELKVTITTIPTPSNATRDSVVFDPRGLAQLGTPKYRKFVIERDGMTDTVCIYGFGKVAINRCQLAK